MTRTGAMYLIMRVQAPAPLNFEEARELFGFDACNLLVFPKGYDSGRLRGEVVAFEVSGLSVQDHGPFHMIEFVLLHEPETALRDGDIEEDDEDAEDDRNDAEEFLVVFARVSVFQ